MASENQNHPQPTTGVPTQGRPQPPAPVVVAPPYVPTPEEQQYLMECATAIVAGCEAAVAAAKIDAEGGTSYLNYANGVKALTAAYIEIKTGGKAATGHQGS